MTSIDAGYDFISSYSDSEVKELYEDRLYHAMKYLKKSKVEDALDMIEDAKYYSDVLDERKVKHDMLDYDIAKAYFCIELYKKL